MKVALYQGPVSFGDVEANLQRVEQMLQKAQEENANVLCMPESFLQGYYTDRETAWANSIDLQGDSFQSICKRFAQYEPMLLLGLNERRGDKLFNTVVVIDRGQFVGRYSKNYLVHKYFERGGEFPVFEKAGVMFGIIICADSSYIEPALIAAMRGAQVIFSPHFNCMAYDKIDDHMHRVRANHVARAIETQTFVCKSNVLVNEEQAKKHMDRVGIGYGDSFIVNPNGRFVLEAGILREKLLIYDIPSDELPGDKRKFHRVSQTIADQLAEEYQKIASD